jgi:hypothetical protein
VPRNDAIEDCKIRHEGAGNGIQEIQEASVEIKT